MKQDKTKKSKYGISALEILVQIISSVVGSVVSVLIFLKCAGLL